MRKLTEKQKKWGSGVIIFGALGLGILIPWLVRRRKQGDFSLPRPLAAITGGNGGTGGSSGSRIPRSVPADAPIDLPIYFGTGSFDVPDVYRSHLARLASIAGQGCYTVVGYASPGGSASTNLEYSRRRAAAVAETLSRWNTRYPPLALAGGQTTKFGSGTANQRVMIYQGVPPWAADLPGYGACAANPAFRASAPAPGGDPVA